MSHTNPALEERLFQAAWSARPRAHAPYSGFRVGAAFHLPAFDEIVVGVNVENASFGATVCAERSALLAAVSRHGAVEFGCLLVATDAERPAVPCAQCLQVLAEFCADGLPVLLANAGGVVERLTLAELLPRPFRAF